MGKIKDLYINTEHDDMENDEERIDQAITDLNNTIKALRHRLSQQIALREAKEAQIHELLKELGSI